jgi:hypothetical protein
MKYPFVLSAISFLLIAGAAKAADGCGPGCHTAPQGGCVIDGWTSGARSNECPVTSRPRTPCGPGYRWHSGGTGGCYRT